MKSIIDAIIDLSAIDAGAMELKLAKLDVASILQTVAENLSPTMIRRDQTLSIELAEDSLAFVGDANAGGTDHFKPAVQCHRIFGKGQPDPHGCETLRGKCQILNCGFGPGIDPEFQKKAFEKFHSKPAGQPPWAGAWVPSSRASPSFTAAMFPLFPSLTGAQLLCVASRLMDPRDKT